MKYIFYTLAGLLVVAAIVFGVWVGVWWCLVGGICALITAIKASVLVPMDVALAVVRILFSGIAGWLTFWVCLALTGLFTWIGSLCNEREVRIRRQKEVAMRDRRKLIGNDGIPWPRR